MCSAVQFGNMCNAIVLLQSPKINPNYSGDQESYLNRDPPPPPIIVGMHEGKNDIVTELLLYDTIVPEFEKFIKVVLFLESLNITNIKLMFRVINYLELVQLMILNQFKKY